MPTTVTKTIGTGGDYTTLQAWEDASPANLVTSDQIWRGECFNQEFFSSSAGLLTVSGTTTDATRYKELTTYAGASFVDNANVQTNALRYNASNGAGIRSSYAWGAPVSVNESYFRISKMQIQSGTAVAFQGTGTTGLVMDKCIIENSGVSNEALRTYGSGTVKNTLVIGRSSAVVALLSNGTNAYNCTFARTGTGTANIFTGAYSTSTLKNCAFFGGATTLASGSSSKTYTTCYTDTASPPSGCTTVAYDTSTGSGFQNKTDATRDFRIKTASALVNAGTVESTHAATDIVGTARPSGAAYDVGAWELVSGGGSQTLTPSLFTNTNTFYAPTVTPGAVTLAPGILTNSQTFYAPTVTPGEVTLAPALFTNDNAFYSPTVTPGAVTLAPDLLSNSNAFYLPTVTPGEVTLTADRFDNSNTFFTHVINLDGEQTLAPALFENTNVFYAPIVTPGGVVLEAGIVVNANSFFAPTVAPGPVTLTPGRLDAVNQFYAATVSIAGSAVYPLPAQVLLGVTYGPTGADYTGTATGGGWPTASEIATAVWGYTQ